MTISEIILKVNNNVKDWYLSYVPNIESTLFPRFAAKSLEIIWQVTGTTNFNYKVDNAAPTAYFDVENETIAIPGWYFSAEAISKLIEASDFTNIALTLINGSTVHEALHLRYTTRSIEWMLNEMQLVDEKIFKDYGKSLCAAILNVIEDLYIESRLTIPAQIREWLVLKNDILFNDEHIVVEASDSKVVNAVQTAVLYKRIALREMVTELVGNDAAYFLEMATTMAYGDLRDRIELAVNFLRCFEPYEFDKDDSEGKSSEGGEGDEDAEFGRDDAEGTIDKETRKEIESAMAENTGEAGEEFNSEVEREVKIAKIAEEERIAKESFKDKDYEVIVVDVNNLGSFNYNEYDPNTMKARMGESFAKALKQMRTSLPQTGRAKKTGSQFSKTRLYRAGMDGKVFASKTQEVSGRNDKVEVVVLVDASGSMNSWFHANEIVTGAQTLFHATMAVSEKIYTALCAQIPVKLLAHSDSGSAPIIYKIAESTPNGKKSNLKRQLSRVANIPLSQNYDGVIIKRIVDEKKGFFSSDASTKKILIVLSDGEPCAPDYYGVRAIAHTKVWVKDASKRGIEVVSVSLTDSANNANNLIYETNVDATGNLDKAMTTLVTKLVGKA